MLLAPARHTVGRNSEKLASKQSKEETQEKDELAKHTLRLRLRYKDDLDGGHLVVLVLDNGHTHTDDTW
jgi:head-tail adaptor